MATAIKEELRISDEQLLEKSIENPDFFAQIVDRYEEPFLRKVRSILGPESLEVEDVVQEAFTKIYINASRFTPQPGAQFSSWAYRILVNTAFTHYQKRKRTYGSDVKLDDEMWSIVPDKEQSEVSEKSEIADTVARVLSKMPEGMAKILSMHFIDDMPQKEIAEREGTSVSAIKTRIHRAKQVFRQIIKSDDVACDTC